MGKLFASWVLCAGLVLDCGTGPSAAVEQAAKVRRPVFSGSDPLVGNWKYIDNPVWQSSIDTNGTGTATSVGPPPGNGCWQVGNTVWARIIQARTKNVYYATRYDYQGLPDDCHPVNPDGTITITLNPNANPLQFTEDSFLGTFTWEKLR